MKIGFVVNDVMTESPAYTTTRLAMQATNMGHEVDHGHGHLPTRCCRWC